MSNPTDGFCIYESSNSGLGQSVWGPRLTAIKNGGFSVVINYGLLSGHITDVTAYINYAAGLGLKVAVSLHDTRIWRDNTYAAQYPLLYADSGNASTGTAFMQYIVAQTKNLSGVWGWYVGDEVLNTDHTTFKTYCDAVKTADSTHPRLIVEGAGTSSTSCCSNNNSTQYDCCDVMGDDYYPIGASSTYSLTTAQTAAATQSFCNAHSLQSVMVLQAHSRSAYSPFPPVALAPWPAESDMLQSRADTLANMNPRLVIWYSYFDVTTAGTPDFAPALQWTYLTYAITGKSGIAMFPATKRRGLRR